MNKVLKVYIAHQGSIDNILHKIKEDTIVMAGGYETTTFENSILRLKCDDSYCGLPDKIVKLFKFVSESPELAEYTHIYKLDEDMEFIKEIDFELTDYMGKVLVKEGIDRGYHTTRCSGHYWNDKGYEGEIYDWCCGGYGYIISRKAFEIVCKVDGTKYPLEDVMVASILGSNGIYPTHKCTKEYYEPFIEYMKRIKTYKDIKVRTWDQQGIPKWIFKSGNEALEDLHPEIIDLYTNQLEQNPEYELFYFSEVERDEFVKDLNQPDVTATYEKLVPPTYKFDFFRYLFAYKYGGVFMDFSTHALIPLNDIIKGYEQILARDFGARDGICAGFIATVPGTSLMEEAIEKCIYHTKYNLYCADPLDVTGPRMLGAIYRRNNRIEEIAVGKITEEMYLYDYKDPDYLYEGDVPIVKYRIPNHYSILYSSRKEDLYYAKLYNERRIYKTNDIKTFKDLKDRKWEGEGIPKWIFKTGPFKAEDLPIVMREIYLDILAKNPGYELFYFSNEDCMISIHHHYGEEYFRLHQKLIPTAYQADFWRYLILKQYGGCYGDFSQIPLVSYDELTEGVDRVFVRDDPSNKSFLYNAVMCAKPGDDIVTRAVEISAKNIKDGNYGIGSLDVTGPTVLGQAFLQKGYNLNPRSREVSLGDYKGSRILQHRYSGGFVCDKDAKNVLLTKLSNHFGLVYNNAHKNIHYDQAWKERKVFKY